MIDLIRYHPFFLIEAFIIGSKSDIIVMYFVEIHYRVLFKSTLNHKWGEIL